MITGRPFMGIISLAFIAVGLLGFSQGNQIAFYGCLIISNMWTIASFFTD